MIIHHASHPQSKLITHILRQIVTSLGDFWSGCHELRKQLVFLSIKYPLTIEALPRTSDGLLSGMKATASVLLLQLNAKVYISYILDNETLARWPRSLEDLKWEIKVAYGDVEYVFLILCVIL